MTDETTKNDKEIIVKVDSDLSEIIPDFLEMTYDDMKTMRTALQDKDFETIRLTAHTLKGSGGGYGFTEVTNLGKKIEDAAKIKDEKGIEEWLNVLINYMNQAKIVYE